VARRRSSKEEKQRQRQKRQGDQQSVVAPSGYCSKHVLNLLIISFIPTAGSPAAQARYGAENALFQVTKTPFSERFAPYWGMKAHFRFEALTNGGRAGYPGRRSFWAFVVDRPAIDRF
jgi:hypothetical protein